MPPMNKESRSSSTWPFVRIPSCLPRILDVYSRVMPPPRPRFGSHLTIACKKQSIEKVSFLVLAPTHGPLVLVSESHTASLDPQEVTLFYRTSGNPSLVSLTSRMLVVCKDLVT